MDILAPAPIDREIRQAAPGLRLGIVRARVVPRRRSDALWTELRETALRRAPSTTAEIREIPEIAALRELYRQLGKDPSRYRGSAEALLRRVVRGQDLYQINSVVDAGNLLSVETGCALGCYDLAAVEPPLGFGVGAAGESYQGIGKAEINLESLPVFRDASGPFGTPTSDSVRTMIRPETRELLLAVVSVDRATDLPAALERGAELLRQHAAATDVATRIVNP